MGTALPDLPTSLPLDRRSLSWRVAAEPTALLGGGRALLLQVAHPKVAAGVEQHSSYASDPWARLFRTLDVMTKLTFGTPEASAEQARLLDRMHSRVVGTTSCGEAYDARDPDLLLWVWATLADTALRCYELVFPSLSPSERQRYYDEWKLVARACGVPSGSCPPTWEDFADHVSRTISDDLEVSPEARRVAHATMVPPLPWPARPAVTPAHQLVTAGLLPAHLREELGIGWDHQRQRRFEQCVAVLGTAMRATPRAVRELPVRDVLRRATPLQVPWLQRHGAKLTAKRMAALERSSG